MWNMLRTYLSCNIKQVREYHTRRTKPRWIPKAKTKVFRVPPRNPLPPDEQAERLRLLKMYKTQAKTMFNVYQQLYREKTTSDDVIAKEKQALEEAWVGNMRINDEWNAQVSLEREQRNAKEFEEEVKQAEKHKLKTDEERMNLRLGIDNFIREQKELSKTFITKNDIDAHLEKIFSSPPSSFNFAIDIDGNVYEGENKTPNPDKKLNDISLLRDDDTVVSQSQISN